MPDRAWAMRPLGDVATWMSGGTPSTDNADYWGGDVPWISAASLRDFNIEDSDRRLTTLGIANGTRLAPKGATIFVVRGMSLKSEFRVGIAQRTVAFGQDCKALVPHDDVDPRYLAWAVKASAPKILTMVDEASHGTGRLETKLVAGHRIGVPPLAEQRRITGILDAIEDQVGVMAKIRHKTNSRLDGILSKLFVNPGDLAWPAKRVSLRDAAYWLSGGTPATGAAEYWGGEIPWISAANLKNFHISTSDRNITRLGAAAGSRLVPPGTTICVVRGMSLKSEFRVGVTTRQVAFGQDCKALIPVYRVDPWYLGYSVRALEPRVLTLVDEAGHGTGRLETRLLDTLCIHVPHLAEQARAVQIAQAAEQELIDCDAELAKLGVLKNALMGDLLTGRVRVPVGAGV